MASSLLRVDKPPFVDFHSLLKRVTLSFLLGAWPVLLSWPPCNAQDEVLGKEGLCNKHNIKLILATLYTLMPHFT